MRRASLIYDRADQFLQLLYLQQLKYMLKENLEDMFMAVNMFLGNSKSSFFGLAPLVQTTPLWIGYY